SHRSLTCIAAAWWGCAGAAPDLTTAASGTAGSSSASSASGTGGTGGVNLDGGGGSDDDAACVSTSAAAHPVPLDIVFLIDDSLDMHGTNWEGTVNALTMFINDPASDGISAGL